MTRPARRFRADLDGFQEVPPILTNGDGRFEAQLAHDGNALRYRLAYRNLSSRVTVAHIHFGQPGVNGGIMAFLCGGNDTPACPPDGGVVSGVITRRDIKAIPEQGLAEGDFHGFLRIMSAGLAYVNVHTTMFPDGEIRGQVIPGRDHDDDDHDHGRDCGCDRCRGRGERDRDDDRDRDRDIDHDHGRGRGERDRDHDHGRDCGCDRCRGRGERDRDR